jgi:tRNA threonylcarbamoyladenosine biosynthesis protein TsaE
MTMHEWIVETAGPAETQAIGSLLGQRLSAGAVVALTGELGAGKTAFTQGIARGMGITAPVTSPTFTLINRYKAPDGRVLQHVDCYRLGNAALEMWDAGLTDLFAGDDIVVIEWADRIPGLLPDDHLDVAFTYVDATRRRIRFADSGAHPIGLVDALARDDAAPSFSARAAA